jgi:hypothetical protein
MRSAATWQRGIGHEQYESMTPLRHLSGEDTAQRWHPIRHSGYPFARDRARLCQPRQPPPGCPGNATPVTNTHIAGGMANET